MLLCCAYLLTVVPNAGLIQQSLIGMFSLSLVVGLFSFNIMHLFSQFWYSFSCLLISLFA
jgi:hypothetical protein